MSLCVIDGKQCQCQPDEGAYCKLACARIAELEQQLAFANDAAAKGETARLTAAGMESRIAVLEEGLGRIADFARGEGAAGNIIARIADEALRPDSAV